MIGEPVELVDVGDENLRAARDFLERNPETSLFLLSNIRAFGPRLGESLYSGNLKALQQAGEIRAVFTLTRGGNLLAQTGGMTDHARHIVEACRLEQMPIRGIVGEWGISKAIWDLLLAEGRLRPTFVSKEISYRLDLAAPFPGVSSAAPVVRPLTIDDHEQWDELALAFQRESGIPAQGTREQHRWAFARSTALGHWWGAFNDGRLVSLAAIIAMHETIAQIGSVFTVPEMRGRGLGRAVMTHLVCDSRDVHGLRRLFLFTGEANGVARRLYESLEFRRFGYFGLFFGDEEKV